MTVEEAAHRFSALEVVEWVAFFKMQDEEFERRRKQKEPTD